MKKIHYLLMLGIFCNTIGQAQTVNTPGTVSQPTPPKATSALPESQTAVTPQAAPVPGSVTLAISQTGTAILGKVVDAQAQALPGVTVTIKGTGTAPAERRTALAVPRPARMGPFN